MIEYQISSLSARHQKRNMCIVGVVWTVALCLLCMPYRGVRHDAQIYFGQAQFHLTPEWMSQDLFFRYGSQDRYSIFSNLFAPVLKNLGLGASEIAVLLPLQGLFWFAVFLLVRKMPSPTRWAVLAAVVVTPHYYGASRTFSFAEPFLTARTLAEPICVLALAALTRGRFAWAFVCLLIALAAHPLLAIPVWTIAWFMSWQRDRRWAWAGLALLLPVVAGWIGVVPFDGLFKRYDAVWFKHVYESDAFDFFSSWGLESSAQALLDLSLLGLATMDRHAPLRSIYCACAWTTCALCLASAVLVDGFHLVLPTQLQLWRSLWVMHLLALVALVPCMQMLWKKSPAGRLAASSLALAAILAATAAQTSMVFVFVSVFLSVAALRGVALRPRIATFGIVICVAGAAVMGAIQALEMVVVVIQGLQSGMALDRLSSIPASIPELTLTIAWVALVTAYSSRWRWALPASLLTGCVAIVFGATHWDQRDDWADYLESHYGQPNPFNVDLPLTAQVYWPEGMLATWVLFQRPAYATLASEAAAVFQRAPTIEIERRWHNVLPMTIQIGECIKLANEGRANYSADQCKYTDVAIRDVCRAPGGPDNVVLTNPIQMPAMGVWNYRPPGREPRPYYLYDCHRF